MVLEVGVRCKVVSEAGVRCGVGGSRMVLGQKQAEALLSVGSEVVEAVVSALGGLSEAGIKSGVVDSSR